MCYFGYMTLRSILMLLQLSISAVSCAQKDIEIGYTNFERQVLDLKPEKSPRITEEDFEFAKMVLRETKASTKDDPENFNVAHYFNVLSAFTSLGLSESEINIAFDKFRDSENSCEYFIAFENIINTKDKYSPIRSEYQQMADECKAKAETSAELDLGKYAEEHQLDLLLLRRISQIMSDDQKFRTVGSSKSDNRQVSLDTKNQLLIDSLFGEYGTYLGRSLVGKEFESAMWAVIQHGPLEMMEKYLPIVHTAVQTKELEVAPLKMLIDRYYGLKYGYQIFGSQMGFDFQLAEEARRIEIANKYNID